MLDNNKRSHRRAVWGMVLVTLMWSVAGVVTRQLEQAHGFELTFWRALFTALAMLAYLLALQAGGAVRRLQGLGGVLRQGGVALWLSGLMWAVMFTCFMLALSLTTVANVLVTMSLAPLFTALLARFLWAQPVLPRTWVAIVLAGLGIAWMYSHGLSSSPTDLLGSAVALGVPVAAAINWCVLQRSGARVDLAPALLVGAGLSSLFTLPLAWPMQASAHDMAWLAGLGIFQLAVPCVLAVRLARSLPAPEMALLALLEVVFGIAWAWLGAGEQPSAQVLAGGGLVLFSLALNEWLGLLSRPPLQSQQKPAAQADKARPVG